LGVGFLQLGLTFVELGLQLSQLRCTLRLELLAAGLEESLALVEGFL